MIAFKKIAKWIMNFLTIVLLIILALVIYGKATTVSKKAYPNYFGYTFFEVASGSMEPTLHINDVILVKITKENLKKGDIIAFSQDGSIITHRIVYIDGEILSVKGDNNNTVDKPIVTNDVIGKVVKIYPELGIWKKVLKEPKILILIFITMLLFDFALSYDGKKEKKVKEKNKEEVEEVVSYEIPKQKEKAESEKLLSLTRKIDVEEINKLLEESNEKETKKEVEKTKAEMVPLEKVFLDEPKKKKKDMDYTVRLDLNEIHKKVDERMR